MMNQGAWIFRRKVLQSACQPTCALGKETSNISPLTGIVRSLFSDVSTSAENSLHGNHQSENNKNRDAATARPMSTALGALKERLKEGPELGDFIRNNVDQYSVYAPKPKVSKIAGDVILLEGRVEGFSEWCSALCGSV